MYSTSCRKSQAGAAGDLDSRNQAGCAIAFDAFVQTWKIKYDKAVACLIKDRDMLLSFYDFPAERCKHLRTTDVIENSFATIHHRTNRSKGCLSNKTALAMIFKLAEAAEQHWRRLDGLNRLPKVIRGIKFATDWRSSDRRIKSLPPDPLRHQNSAIARSADIKIHDLPQESTVRVRFVKCR